jgi:hypothetical protein
MFGQKKTAEASVIKPVWQMDAQERVAEQQRRVLTLAQTLQNKGGKVIVVEDTIHLETDLNNYYVDIAPYDPRIVKVTVIYEIVPGDLDRASWASYNAGLVVHGAKAKALPLGEGYRLEFVSEVFANTTEVFTDAISFYLAAIEDCREAFMKFVGQAAEMETLSWSNRPSM